MFKINKILKPRYLLVLLALGGGALFTMLQATSNQCVSTTDGDFTAQSTFGDQSGCGDNLALDYIISAGNLVSWSGFEGPITGNVEVESGGSLDINGHATFGGTLTNAGTFTVEAADEPETPTLQPVLSSLSPTFQDTPKKMGQLRHSKLLWRKILTFLKLQRLLQQQAVIVYNY